MGHFCSDLKCPILGHFRSEQKCPKVRRRALNKGIVESAAVYEI